MRRFMIFIAASALAALIGGALAGTPATADTIVSIQTGDHSIDSGAERTDRTPGSTTAPVCRYEPISIPPTKPMWYADRHHIPVDDGTGSWFLKLCGPSFGGVVYISRTDPSELLAAARQRLTLPAPVVRFSPATTQVVRVPTWMWIDASSWTAPSSTLAVPGVSVTVRAHPIGSIWTMGDGTTVRCAGPGTPFDAATDDPAHGSTCSHTYNVASANEPGGVFTGAVTVTWRAAATVTGASGSGQLPNLTRTQSFTVRVEQVQALNETSDPR